jgi:hypothetical protein
VRHNTTNLYLLKIQGEREREREREREDILGKRKKDYVEDKILKIE